MTDQKPLQQRPVVVLDVAYDDENASARAAAVVANAIVGGSVVDVVDVVVNVAGVAPYVPGAFFARELPCLLAALAQISLDDHVLMIDGYVVLDEAGRAGLGQHLHEATGRAVIGVAKSSFRGSTFARAVRRGSATRPLYVTAVGVDINDAAAAVAAMAGRDRLPSLVLRADQLARGHLAPGVRAV